MTKLKMICLLGLLVFFLTGCQNAAAPKPPSSAQGGDAASSGAADTAMSEFEDNPDITQNIDSIIQDLSGELGEPPEDVIGFGVGYRRKTAINPSENEALLSLYTSKAATFEVYHMGCDATYQLVNNTWIGKAGFNKYDRLGNLDKSIGKTEFDIVSLDKTVKNASTEKAQAEIDRGSIYAYWIVSLPDDNDLEGVVYDKGADHQLEPVKKGTLHFERVGPGPSSVDVQVKVDEAGNYKTEGELTAGHYKVSFDPKDGKGEEILNNNWLYIPGDTPTQDWEVLVRKTYTITYDIIHTAASDNAKLFEAHMEWHHIPIDWKVESEEALELGTLLGFDGMYCLTYDYYENHVDALEPTDESEDENETTGTPGYEPSILEENTPKSSDGTVKITQTPTLSFFRANKGSLYKEGAYYMNLEYGVSMITSGMTIDVPLAFEIGPLPYENEVQLSKQGWGELSRIARLKDESIEDLMESDIPLVLTYEDDAPNTVRVKVTIKLEE